MLTKARIADLKSRITYIDGQITSSTLYAQWWIARATTGATVRRDVTRSGVQLTDEQKIDDALQTANQHIRNINEFVETRAEFIRELGEHYA